MKKTILPLLFVFFTGHISGQTPHLIVPIGHITGLQDIAFSPDGKYVLTGSTDHTAKLWDLKGHEIQTFTGHKNSVESVAFSPDGKRVLTGSTDSTAILWDLYGKVIQTFTGHGELIESAVFSPDGKYILTGGGDNKARLWSVDDGRIIQTFKGHKKDVNTVAFSPDGKQILTSSKDSTAKIWNLNGEVVQTFTGHKGKVKSAVFSPDGKQVLTGSDDKTAKLWSLDGQVVQTFTGHQDQVNMAVFSPDGSRILTSSHDQMAKLWSLDGKVIRTFEGPASNPMRVTVAFSPDGRQVLTGYKNGSAKLWDLNGRPIQIFQGHSKGVYSLAVSPDGKQMLAGNTDGTAKLWNLAGNEVRTCRSHTDGVTSAAFSPAGQALTGSKDYKAKLWDMKGRLLKTFENPDAVAAVAFSPDGKQVLTGSGTEAKLWNPDGSEGLTFTDGESIVNAVAFSPACPGCAGNGKRVLTGGGTEAKLWGPDGQVIQSFQGHGKWVTSVAFSPDGKQILTGSEDKTAKLWDASGQVIQTLTGHTKGISSVDFSPDGKRMLTGSFDKTAKLWDMNGRVLQTFTGHAQEIYSAVFMPDGKFVVTGSFDNTVKLWDAASGKERATLMAIDSNDWVLTTPSGLFDASPGAMNLMHFVAGLEVIELEQLKERYYEPGLLAKILGLSQDPMRNPEAFNEVALFPGMDAQLSADKLKLQVSLTPRNGGIGKLSVFVNDKEVKEDANPQRAQAVTLDLTEFAKYYLPDTINKLGLRVYNSAGWLKSQAFELNYSPPAPGKTGPTIRKKQSLYAVVIGTANYAGDQLDLQFADRDATHFSQALRAAAAKVFGDRVYVTLLNTDDKDLSRQDVSSKVTIRQAFEAIAAKAQPQDVLLIYGSGHGVNYGTAENSQFYYLTKDIAGENLDNPEIRQNYAISSAELTEWIKSIYAQKQVLILDACNSGKLVDDLAAGRNDLSSSQVRALDRMKDRTGMYILTGSAADKVSYEAGEYGQGLLTFSLLQAMSGLALKEGKFVDVMTLFQYSRDKVPELAKGIGGIQTPVLAFPPNPSSFNIGIKDASVKITLAEPKPVFIRSNFHDENDGDELELVKALEEHFRKIAGKGAQAELIYTDANEYENGYSIRGGYAYNGDAVEVRGSLFKGKTSLGKFQVTGKKGDVPELVEAIMEKVGGMVK
ncbi:MAG TPA: caspase family protein [Saprospiraceae bacterium]|nr:caspase family protein [Saprospiraceae bacterium]